MQPLRVLITNVTLAGRTGTELFVRDLALGLLRRGHTPVVYSTDHGELAGELARAGVAVVADLGALGVPPDLIHANHHPEAVTALLHFPDVPALFVCHDRLTWHSRPPRFSRIRRCVAVDDNCRDRLLLEAGIPDERVRVILTAVDLERFRPRAKLPKKPRRALVFSNSASEQTHLGPVREACAKAGLELDVIGADAGRSCAAPEQVLGRYDVVFAKARCALEALAVGCAVVLCDARGVGPLVTAAEFDRLRRLNLGMRTLQKPLRADVLASELGRYDAADAADVARRAREVAGLDQALDQWLDLYREVLDEPPAPEGAAAEFREAAGYLRDLAPFPELRAASARIAQLDSDVGGLRAECDGRRADADRLADDVRRLAEEKEQTWAELRRAAGERDRLHAEVLRQAGQAGRWQVELELKAAETAGLVGECERLTAEQGQLREAVQRLTAEKEQLWADADKLVAERDRLWAEAQEAAGERDRLCAEAEARQAQLTQWWEQARHWQAEAERLAAECAARAASEARLTAELAGLRESFAVRSGAWLRRLVGRPARTA
jgi:hypothetical protein